MFYDFLAPNQTVFVVVESVYSMDGDMPDLIEIAKFCKEKNIKLDLKYVTVKYGAGDPKTRDSMGNVTVIDHCILCIQFINFGGNTLQYSLTKFWC